MATFFSAGHGHLLSPDPIPALLRLQALHGDVFRLDLGSTVPCVVVCSMRAVADAFRKDAFAGRHFNQIPTFRWLIPTGKDGE